MYAGCYRGAHEPGGVAEGNVKWRSASKMAYEMLPSVLNRYRRARSMK